MRSPLFIGCALLLLAGGSLAADKPLVVDISTVCPEALAGPSGANDILDAESAFEWQDARATQQPLQWACKGWVASVRQVGALPARHQPLAWQALAALVLLGEQRRDEGLLLAREAYDAALAQGPASRFILRRAALALGQAAVQVRDQDAMLLWTQRAVDANDAVAELDSEGATVLTNRASADLASGRFDEGAGRLEELLARMRGREREFAYPMAVAGNQLVYARRSQGRWQEALVAAQQLVAHRRQWLAVDRSGLGLALYAQAASLLALGRFDEGEALLYESVREVDSVGSIDVQTSGALQHVRSGLAVFLLARGKPREAYEVTQAALPALRGGARLNVLQQAAVAQLAMGELAGALASWREALGVVQQQPPLGEAWLRLRVMLGYVQAMLTLGDRSEAERWLAAIDAEAERAPPAAAERGERWLTLALLREQQGRRDEALAALDQADAFYAAQLAPDHPQRRELAIRACGMGRGCDALAERLPVVERDARAGAAAYLVLARDRLARGDGAGAAEHARRAIQNASAAAQPLLQWQALADYARSQRLLNRRDESILFGKLALGQLQRARNTLAGLGPEADALYLADKAQLFRDVAGWLFDAGRLAEGLEVLRLFKRSELDDFQERAAAIAQAEPSLTPAEQARRERLEEALQPGSSDAAEILRLSRMQASRRISSAESARLQALLTEQQAAVPALRERLSRVLADAPAEVAGPGSRPLVASELPRPRDAQTLHAYLLSGPDQLRAVLVGATQQRLLRAPLGAAELGRLIAALLDAVRLRQDATLPTQALYRHLGPLLDKPAQAMGARRIVLWLDGPLRYLPLALLHDGRTHLGERYALSVATPVPVSPVTKADVTASLRVRAWGVTQALAGLPALPGVGDELCGIVSGPVRGLASAACKGALPGEADANTFFTEAAWRAAGLSGGASLVHVSTHFVLRPGNVSQSWLLLGDGSRLALDKLRGWPLGSPRLLTLSACETAVPGGTDADGRELDGLTATLLAGGAAQIVASLWRVDDRGTAPLMQRLYAELKRRPGDVAVALQTAQREARRSGAPAHVWAAFTVSEPAR